MTCIACMAIVVVAPANGAAVARRSPEGAKAAQGTTASIQGTIVDEGGPLPGATIVAKDNRSPDSHTKAVADTNGAFTLSGLRPGTTRSQ